jgi:hypothetical protein
VLACGAVISEPLRNIKADWYDLYGRDSNEKMFVLQELAAGVWLL